MSFPSYPEFQSLKHTTFPDLSMPVQPAAIPEFSLNPKLSFFPASSYKVIPFWGSTESRYARLDDDSFT